MRTLKVIIFLLLLAGGGLVGFAYLGDLDPERTETRLPVSLDES